MATKAESAPITVAKPYAAVFDACARALIAAGFQPGHADPAQGTISATSSMGLATWGENVTVRVGAYDAHNSVFTVYSALKFGLVDWGKNKKNVDKITAAIQAEVTRLP